MRIATKLSLGKDFAKVKSFVCRLLVQLHHGHFLFHWLFSCSPRCLRSSPSDRFSSLRQLFSKGTTPRGLQHTTIDIPVCASPLHCKHSWPFASSCSIVVVLVARTLLLKTALLLSISSSSFISLVLFVLQTIIFHQSSTTFIIIAAASACRCHVRSAAAVSRFAGEAKRINAMQGWCEYITEDCRRFW